MMTKPVEQLEEFKMPESKPKILQTPT